MSLVAIEKESFEAMIAQIAELNTALRNQTLEDIYARVLKSADAAKYLKIDLRHLSRLKDEGRISFIQEGKIVRYRREDLDNWLLEHRVASKWEVASKRKK